MSKVSPFRVPKAFNKADKCDDAYAFDARQDRFAVSDGATEGVFNDFWAKLLVDHFVAQQDSMPADWNGWLPAAQEKWVEHFKNRSVPYHAEEGLRAGSFATFLGLVLKHTYPQQHPALQSGAPPVQGANGNGSSPRGEVALASPESSPKQNAKHIIHWHAAAVGDSCLFHTREEKLLSVFPLRTASDFNNRTSLIGSRTPLAEITENRARSTSGEALPGDQLWMMTDAMAHWFLAEFEAERNPVEHFFLYTIMEEADEDFADWISKLRTKEQIVNDDVTVLVIDF